MLRIINFGIKTFYTLRAKANEIKYRGLSTIFKELVANPRYFLYKTFSINPKYLTPRLRPAVEKEEKLLRTYIKQGDLVLDAGCGDGRNGLKIVEELNLNPKMVILFDINPGYLKKLSKFVRVRSKDNRYFIMRSSIFDIGLRSNMFDVVICTGAVLSLADGGSIEDGLLELKRVVRGEGVIIFSLITMERLLKTAEERWREDIKENILQTGIYHNWNEQYGEGLCKGWNINEVNTRIEALGLEILSKDVVYIDHKDIPDSVVLAGKKKSERL